MMPGRLGASLVLLVVLSLPVYSHAVLIKTFARGSGPIHLTADRLEHDRKENTSYAEGSVEIRQEPLFLTADRARLNHTTGELTAEGNVAFRDDLNEVHADRMELNVNTELGRLYHARFFLRKENYHLAGEEVERVSEQLYRLDDASFTTCDCPDSPDWRFRAKKLRVHLDQYLTARHVFFDIKGIPILYLPYLIYPVVTERQTGFLVPRAGYSTEEGFKFQSAFYWAIAANQDATLSLDYRSERGIGGDLEYRYLLSRRSGGTFDVTYFRDKEIRQDRLEFFYRHDQTFSDRLSAKINIHSVNTRDFFRDLSELTAERGARNIESNVVINYRDSVQHAYLLGRYTQDLTSPSNTTLQRLPEVGYRLLAYRLGRLPLFLDLEGTGTHFWRDEGLTAVRGDLYPRLSIPVTVVPGIVLAPFAGVRETIYSRTESAKDTVHREAYPMGGRLALTAARPGDRWRHQIASTWTYEYIPVKNGSGLPQFDEIDAIQSQHRLTASLDNAWLRRMDGGGWREFAYLRLTDTYSIDRAREGDPRPFSDLRQETGISPIPELLLEVDAFYDPYDGRYDAVHTDLTVRNNVYLALTVGHRYSRESIQPEKGDLFNPLSLSQRIPSPKVHYLTEKIVLRSPWGIHLASKAFYDVERGGFDEIDYGLRFEAQCWSITVIYMDLREKNQLTFMVTLRGAGGFASRDAVDLF